MKYSKVVYVRYVPLTRAIYTDLYFEELVRHNIEVAYLDLTALFFKDKAVAEEFSFPGTVKIDSYKQLENYFRGQQNGSTLYISIMTFEWRVFKVFRLFTKYQLNTGVFARGVFPSSAVKDNKAKIARLIKAINFERIKLLFANKATVLAKKYGYIKPYDYIFKAGQYGYFGLGMGSETDYAKAEIIEVNTVDYDKYIIHKDQPGACKENYIVFLDQYLPYHPDTIYLKIKTVAPEPYYKEINNFFDRLEKATGMKVVIAAHPKADRYRDINPFNGRDIYFNQSNDLVKGASLVLTHMSTAICFPVCYDKRIVLLMSQYLNEVFPQYIPMIESIVNACGATLIMMDEKEEINIPKKIDPLLYNDFKYKYLTSTESENIMSKDIFLKFLKGGNYSLSENILKKKGVYLSAFSICEILF